MATRITDEGEKERIEAEWFRFDTEALEDYFNGDPWVLVAGEDYPSLWPFKTLVNRLRQNAYVRHGRLHVWRIAEGEVRVQFYRPTKK